MIRLSSSSSIPSSSSGIDNMRILELPQELLAQVLGFLQPADIIRFGRSCHSAWAFVGPENQLLWQSAFLQIFDHPEDAWSHLLQTAKHVNREVEDEWDWHVHLKRRMAALQVISHNWTGDFSESTLSPEEVIDAIIDIIYTAKTDPSESELAIGKKPEVDDRSSSNIALLPTKYDFSVRFDMLIRGLYKSQPSDIWHSPGRPTTRSMTNMPGPRTEAASRLHVLGGVTKYEEQDGRSLGLARRTVYDWNATDELNDYGPFKRDGSGEVDWTRLEAVCSVVTRQFARASQGRMILPQGFDYSIPHRTLVDPTVPNDWARVTGSWCGTYVFLNWEDLIEFNVWGDRNSRPTLEDGPESCGGLMKLELKLDENLKDDPKLKSGLPICNDLPPLYFSGISKSYNFQMVTGVRGMACLTPGTREVRWRFIIHYSGEDQWQLEGVQPGGVRSGCVYGLWTSCTHEEGGPVGPFLYAPEELCKTTAIVRVS